MNPEWIHVGMAALSLGVTVFVAYIMSQVKNGQLRAELAAEKQSSIVKAELVAADERVKNELDVHKAEDRGNFDRLNEGIERIERRLDARL
jgi:hypothetical protein